MAKRQWLFATKKEAIAKLKTLTHKYSYEIVKNRDECGRFAKGWIIR